MGLRDASKRSKATVTLAAEPADSRPGEDLDRRMGPDVSGSVPLRVAVIGVHDERA